MGSGKNFRFTEAGVGGSIMIDIFILGTSGMTPLPHRHLCSCLVRQNSNYCLIDAGEGTQVALKKASLSLKKINYLLLTHYHTDHIGGLPGLLASMANSEKTDTLTIVGPKGLNNVVDAAKRMVSRLPFRIKTIEITEGNQSLKLDSFMIKPFMVDHKTPCFGYQFQLSRAGRFSEELAKQNNVPEEIWSEIQQKNIVPYNGRIYTQDLIMDIPRKGLKFVYVTDTRLCESMRVAAKGADLMICEGMYYELPKTGNAANNYHMTMIEAASLAASSGVKEMILTHFSPSIIDPTIYSDRLHGICKNITIGTDGMVRTLQYMED